MNPATPDAASTLAQAPKGVSGGAGFHDFRDRGNPMVKIYPLTDWRSWERRQDDYEELNH